MTEATVGTGTGRLADATERSLPLVAETLPIAERQVRIAAMIERFQQTVLASFPAAKGISLTDSLGVIWDVYGIFSTKSGELYGLSMHSGAKPKAVGYFVSSFIGGDGNPSADATVSDWSEKRRPMWDWLNQNTPTVFGEIQAKLDELLPPVQTSPTKIV